jgi:diguanylate cyclase (GGDEF)-like protein
LDQASTAEQAAVFRCPAGLLGFAVKLRQGTHANCFLVAAGVREPTLDLFRLEKVSHFAGIDPFDLLEHTQKLPVTTEADVHTLARQVFVAARALTGEPTASATTDATDRLQLVTTISACLDEAETVTEVFTLLQETIGILFDVPDIAAAVLDHDSGQFAVQGTWGSPLDYGSIRPETMALIFPKGRPTKLLLMEDALSNLLPHSLARKATCQSITGTECLLGALFFIDREFSSAEYLLVDLLVGRATQRLTMLHQQLEFTRKGAMLDRFLAMISSLALTEGQELYDLVLQMASELTDASTGSLMLLEEGQESLQIKSSLGMSPHLMKAMNVRVGSGIAGKVAQSGHPLLVRDIEKDARVSTTNRPRFKTKSFISLPLFTRVRVSGVLNLSDKRNLGAFTDADLKLLTPFANHISIMMQRSSNQEQLVRLERLSITDPLTELYNRRFLERRMQEEINRSVRNELPLAVLMIDLDHFKTYNDLCGHVAGDTVLQKVATILCLSVRDMDVVTRYGGEEFCILLPGTSPKEAAFVANRIRHDIQREQIHGAARLPFGRLTASIGIASFPEDASTSTTLVNAADIALYAAKSGGRNQVAMFSDITMPARGNNPPGMPLLA